MVRGPTHRRGTEQQHRDALRRGFDSRKAGVAAQDNDVGLHYYPLLLPGSKT